VATFRAKCWLGSDRKRKVCKIGVSNNPDKRLQTVQVGYPWDLKMHRYVKIANAVDIEKKLHNRFADFRLNGEWFSSQVIDLIDWGEIG
jgi:hypothetical protein